MVWVSALFGNRVQTFSAISRTHEHPQSSKLPPEPLRWSWRDFYKQGGRRP